MGTLVLLRRTLTRPVQTMASTLPLRTHLHLVGTVCMAAIGVCATVAALPLLPLASLSLGTTERLRLRLLTGTSMLTTHTPPPRHGLLGWVRHRIVEPATWRETTNLLISIPMAAIVLIAGAIEFVWAGTLLGAPIVALERPVTMWDLTLRTPLETWPVVVAGLLSVILFLYVNSLFALVHAALSEALIAGREEKLNEQITALDLSRAVIVDAFDAERRRIERDLHDGVQQHLVETALSLGLVRRQVVGDQAEALIDRAIWQNRAASAALRQTILGVSPPLLADHGFIAALRALADGSNLTITLEIEAGLSALPRSDARNELAAYYIVTEALTNVAKHSGAHAAVVRIGSSSEAVLIEVTDLGKGGADPFSGSGLAGLRERAAALGGTFAVSSDVHGTVVTATIPWTEITNSAPARHESRKRT